MLLICIKKFSILLRSITLKRETLENFFVEYKVYSAEIMLIKPLFLQNKCCISQINFHVFSSSRFLRFLRFLRLRILLFLIYIDNI